MRSYITPFRRCSQYVWKGCASDDAFQEVKKINPNAQPLTEATPQLLPTEVCNRLIC